MRVRRKAVEDGRAMVRVRRAGGSEKVTAAVCPGCWNSPVRRPALIAQLAREGLEVADPADGVDGRYRQRSPHASGCPWRKI